jgi:hypothetical protein
MEEVTMELDKEKIEKILAEYGFTFEDVITAEKKKHVKKPTAEQDWIYLIHHMHQPKKEEDMETLHHCFLFEKKGMKGRKFSQRHVKDGKVFQHVLDIKEKEVDGAPKIVYDHLNNGFKIKIMEINKKKWVILTGMVSLKDTKWSDQDRK